SGGPVAAALRVRSAFIDSLRIHDLYLCRTCQRLGRSGPSSHWSSREISRVRPKRKPPRTATRIMSNPTRSHLVRFSAARWLPNDDLSPFSAPLPACPVPIPVPTLYCFNLTPGRLPSVNSTSATSLPLPIDSCETSRRSFHIKEPSRTLRCVACGLGRSESNV